MRASDIARLSAPERLLWSYGVRHPDHIDLEAIAISNGAHVVYRRLDGCAARLVASADQAVISVAVEDNPGRQRFSLGHELAHWLCDANRSSFLCASADIGPQNAEAKDTEAHANRFASQLVLPDYLVAPWIGSKSPSLDLARDMATAFRVSLTAAAIKLVRRSAVPAIVACHDQQRLRWFQRNLSFPHELFVIKQLHHDTHAFELAFNATSGMSRPRKESATRWLIGAGSFRQEVLSQSVRLPDGTVLSVISII